MTPGPIGGSVEGADIEIRVVPAARLPLASAEEILALCQHAYDEDLRSSFRTFESPVHVVGTIGTRIVTHALWITRLVSVGGRAPLRTAYIEAVATEPAFQGRGYGSCVMREIIKSVADFDLAALSPSDRALSLYVKLDWQAWRGPLFIRTDSGMVATPDEIVMVHRLPGTPQLDMTASLSAEWREGEVW